MEIIFILLGVGVLGVVGFFVAKYFLFRRYLLNSFKEGNCIVYGRKGKGKDLVFNYVINHSKKHYYSNVDYGHGDKFHYIRLKDLSVYPNTFENCVNENIVLTEHKFMEGSDFYISDIGIFLPSYMDSKLYTKYPSMPIIYALSRHLYNSNIHCNTQSVERGWKALREQADTYIWVRKTIKIFGLIFITRMIVYEKYETAKKFMLPLKSRLFNKESKARADEYNATNGSIKEGFVIQFKKQLTYDTRYFEKKFLIGERK